MKSVIITGSKGLIGKSVTSNLKENGYNIIEADLSLGYDLSDEQFAKDFFLKNRADALVNLFALNDHIDSKRSSNKLMDIELSMFEKFLSVNVTALFSVCREFARNNESGSIVNFTSTYGVGSPYPFLYQGDEKNIAYGVSKAAVIQLTKHLAVHLAPTIRVNCILPGGVKHEQSREFQEKYAELTPIGRMMNVEELNGIVRFLVSEESSYCTGSVYPVDGGWTAW
jgi:NAD(P)-dependent dehydrogenase (short-subunit alcohol dehydrogenase family)